MGLGTSPARQSRCAAVAASVTAVVALLAHWLLPAVSAGPPAGAGFPAALVWGCTATTLGVALWLWVTTMLVVLEARRGSGLRALHAGAFGLPLAARRMVLGACGVALTSGLVAPAVAGAVPGHQAPPVAAPRGVGVELLRGLRLPERVAVGPPHRAAAPAPRATRPANRVVVEPGDTLWSIAAEALGRAATPRAVAAYWPAIYRLNAVLVGPDPDLIEPGQVLRLPSHPRDDGGRR